VQTEFGAVVLVAQSVTVVPEFAMAWQVFWSQAVSSMELVTSPRG